MLLTLENNKISMKMVYLLSEELKSKPEQIALTQALTLDYSKPMMGLKGTWVPKNGGTISSKVKCR